jgi:hypothetical protein
VAVRAVTVNPAGAVPTLSRWLIQHADEQLASTADDLELRETVLADVGLRDLATEVQRHLLDAVAEAEHGDAELQDARVHMRRPVGVDRCGAAGKDERRGCAALHLFDRYVERNDLGVHPRLTDPARDQLRVLRTEVENEDRGLLVVITRH